MKAESKLESYPYSWKHEWKWVVLFLQNHSSTSNSLPVLKLNPIGVILDNEAALHWKPLHVGGDLLVEWTLIFVQDVLIIWLLSVLKIRGIVVKDEDSVIRSCSEITVN